MKTKIALAAALVAIYAAPAAAFATSDYDEILRNSGWYVPQLTQPQGDSARGAFAQTNGVRNVVQPRAVLPFTAEEKAWFERASSSADF